MKKLILSDLMNIYEYEKVRNSFRKNIIAYKMQRRFQLGSTILITFENRRTMKYQILEMMRAERLVDELKIQHELDVYNSLLPEENELSATLFIEITAEEQIQDLLHKFIGLTEGQAVYLKIGDEKVMAEFEEGREAADKISSVHYIRFRFSRQQINRMVNDDNELSIGIDYKEYQQERTLNKSERSNLLSDFDHYSD
jgi:DNA primase large subunit